MDCEHKRSVSEEKGTIEVTRALFYAIAYDREGEIPSIDRSHLDLCLSYLTCEGNAFFLSRETTFMPHEATEEPETDIEWFLRPLLPDCCHISLPTTP